MPRAATRQPRLTVLVNCAVTPEFAERLRALAIREERTISSVVRQALREFFERRAEPPQEAA
jgi:predicted transcriptional regulator